eukprot:1006525-Amphidinium_carterae.1
MVSTVQKTVEIPQVQILEVIQDMPIIKDCCLPMVLHVLDMPVVKERAIPMIEKCQGHEVCRRTTGAGDREGAKMLHGSVQIFPLIIARQVVDMPVVRTVELPIMQKASTTAKPRARGHAHRTSCKTNPQQFTTLSCLSTRCQSPELSSLWWGQTWRPLCGGLFDSVGSFRSDGTRADGMQRTL